MFPFPSLSEFQAIKRRLDTLEREFRSTSSRDRYKMASVQENTRGSGLITCIADGAIEPYEVVLVHQSLIGLDYVPSASKYTAALADTYAGASVLGIAQTYAIDSAPLLVQTDGKTYAYFDEGDESILTGNKLVPNDSGHVELTDDTEKFYALEDSNTDDEIVLLQFALGGGGAVSTGGGIPVKITSQVDYNNYKCSVYANGPDVAATATNQDLRILQIAIGETVPNDTWLDASYIGTKYYGQIAVWL